MKWAIAADMMGMALVTILIGFALREYKGYHAFGSILIGLGCGSLAYALIAPWITN